jgi:hypothetical protein
MFYSNVAKTPFLISSNSVISIPSKSVPNYFKKISIYSLTSYGRLAEPYTKIIAPSIQPIGLKPAATTYPNCFSVLK